MATLLDVHGDNDEWWRECAAWLTRCEMLRRDHRANGPQGTVRDLANILRDGVLLCQLLNKLDPGCIDMKEVNLKPTMAQFLCLHNIEIFLKTCLTNFDLHQNDLFEPLMLFDLSDFHKVLCTLSKLSQCPKAQRGNIEGFAAKKCSEEDEDIYQCLKTVGPMPKVQEFDHSTEAIYQDLLETREPQLPLPLQKRDFVIKELMDTEKNYVDVLGKLKKYFVEPLRNSMKPEDHEVIFCKIDDLYIVHSEFYKELQSSQKKLSAIFMQWREKFLIYGKYCSNLMRATNLLQDFCDTNPSFHSIILSYEKEYSDSRFKLRDVLSVPMQRILKYHLLLEKLIESTDPNHEEYNELKRAREAMMDVAHYINEAARDSDHQVAVISKLQRNIIEWVPSNEHNLLQYGRLIKDIELKIKHHDDQRTRTRYVFIFYKCILICKQHKNNLFGFRDIINIADYHVEELSQRPILNKDARWCYAFYLVKNDNNTAYTIFVRSPEIKEQLIKAINDALENIHPLAMKHTNHTFELHSFNDPIQCQYCSKYLKGLFHQGYKCAVCGIASHKACIANSGRCGAVSSHNSNSRLPLNSVNGTEGSLRYKLWFVGEMDRVTAQEKLDKRENGTYLVRIRPTAGERDKYALSLKTNNKVTHMKIFMDSQQKKYYMSLSKFFNSIEELILNYQTQDLRENFIGLEPNTRLLWPFKQLQVTALRNYRPAAENEIELIEGQTLLVIGKEGYSDGWWRGRTDFNKTGYFPCSHVRIETEVTF